MPTELIEFDPASLGDVTLILSLSAAEAAMLSSAHPFLSYGDWRGFAALTDGRLNARLVASIDPRQQSGALSVGCLGFMCLADRPDGDDRDIRERLVEAALGWLRARRIDVVRGPIEFSTWYGHRAMTSDFPDAGGDPVFPLEPRHGRSVVELLESSGFHAGHRAVSYMVDSRAVTASAADAWARSRSAGLRSRPLCTSRLEDELRLFHVLSTDLFSDSWGFSELSFEEFASMYRPLADLVDAELVRVLETPGGTAVGFAFAIPVEPTQDGQAAFVVKTLGVLADARRRHPGAGAALTAMIHDAACQRGYTSGIHALMAQGSPAHRLSSRWGRPLRTYATFERATH
jgi:GNAT superfamily N-acetyltransferase